MKGLKSLKSLFVFQKVSRFLKQLSLIKDEVTLFGVKLNFAEVEVELRNSNIKEHLGAGGL